MNKNTKECLKKNYCFCLRKQEMISIIECNIPNCHRQTSCSKQLQKDIYGKES